MYSSEFKSRIEKLTEDYYNKNNKNLVFKSNQKADCANYISSSLNVDELIQNTAYIIPGTNKVFIDYTIFKTYGTPEVFQPVINHIKNLNISCIEKYGSFEVHLNCESYTVSAHERYKEIFILFTNAHMNCGYLFSELVSGVFVYNTPSIINIVLTFCKPFIETVVLSKIILYDKHVSKDLLHKLLCSK